MKPRGGSGSSPQRRSTLDPVLPQAEAPRKVALRSKKFFTEPAPWFAAQEGLGADSDAESVTSEYREDTDASASTAGVHLQSSSGSEANTLTMSPTATKKSTDLELPLLPGRQAADVSPLSASRSSWGEISNKTEDLQVSASTAGEWVTRLAALQEVAHEHAACAGRIWQVMKETFPEANDVTQAQEAKMQESILQELETSRQLLEQHAQGLVGTDLAELRLLQAETKRANDRLVRMDKLYAKELNALRTLLDKTEVKAAPKEDYEPLTFLEPEERGCVLTLIEEKLQALFLEQPDLELMINQKEYLRLQELFKKERLSSLERQVAKSTQELDELMNQVTMLEAENEKLTKRHAKEMRRASSSSSRSLHQDRRPSGGKSPAEWQRVSSGEGQLVRQISTPVGKPKAGRPKRGAKYSRREAGDESS